MSSQEKGPWIFLVITITVPAIYFALVFGQLGETPVDETNYVPLMIGAIVAMVVTAIIGYVVIAAFKPSEADKKDERDDRNYRRGEAVVYNVLGFLNLLPLGLAMVESEQFRIANAIFPAGALAPIAASIAKLVIYRRGF